ncbi:MAG: fibronectin type III domain-containing protein [Bacteroidales bacterium]
MSKKLLILLCTLSFIVLNSFSQNIVVNPTAIDFGKNYAGNVATGTFNVTNYSSETVTILVDDYSDSDFITSITPTSATLNSFEDKTFTIEVKYPNQITSYSYHLYLILRRSGYDDEYINPSLDMYLETILQPPSAPTSLTFSNITTSSFKASWTQSSEATGYNVYLNGTKKYTTSSTSYTFSNLSSGTTYNISVGAYNDAGESKISKSVTTPPTAPTNFTAAVHSSNWITLYWTPSYGATGYSVYSNGSIYTGISSYVDIYGSNVNNQQYELWATNSGGSSTKVTLNVTPNSTFPPAAPTTLTFSNATYSSFQATWNATLGATGYNIYLDGIKYTTASSSYVFYNVSSGSNHTVSVEAYNTYGVSVEKITKSIITPPAAPTNFTATVHCSNWVSLYWTPSNGATSYNIQWNGNIYTTSSQGTVDLYGADLNNQLYTLWAVNSGGDSPKVTLKVFTVLELEPISVELQESKKEVTNNITLNNIFLYPNPTQGILNINLPKDLKSTPINIYSIDGKLVISRVINSDKPFLNVENLTRGFYIIKICGYETDKPLKFFKE